LLHLTSHFLQYQMRFLAGCFLLVFALTGLSSCKSDKEQEETTPSLAAQILGNEGEFRGNKMGDTMDSVARHDSEFLFKRTRDELNYSIPFSQTDSAHFDVIYVFDRFGLFEIQVDIYTSNNKENKELFKEFREFLVNRYGAPIEKPESAFWKAKTGDHNIEITLRDESADYDKPFLSLNILEPYSHNY
jgi:hypothetical protein